MWKSLITAGAALVLLPMAPVGGVASTPAPAVSPIGLSSVNEVSFDGRYVWDSGADQVVDRLTGARSVAPQCLGDHCISTGFVRDNPLLTLQFEYGPRPISGEAGDTEWNKSPLIGVYLVSTTTGGRQRIDTDSAGGLLVPTWSNQRTCGNEWCDNFYDFPSVFVSADSVSRDGQKVAFCTNYAQPKAPVLYVKDLGSGRLTNTGLRCPIVHHPEGLYTRAPQISANGRIVHVNGDYIIATEPKYKWDADKLYFTGSGSVRTVTGWGSMTRDGGSIFIRRGVRPLGGTASATWDQLRTGVYNVKTRKITRLAGTGDRIYGREVAAFSAFDNASYRGRFVTKLISAAGRAPDRASVIDRRTGATTDLASLLRTAGYQPFAEEWDPVISGDGKVVIATVTTAAGSSAQAVAITGWEPTARAKVAPNAAGSQLVVNVDPDRGSGYWTFRVQAKRTDGSWRTLQKTYRTQGAHETRTIALPAGTYRVRVNAKSGYLGSTSAEATLTR